MLPAPAAGSPPLTDQVTAAASPLGSTAENRCTGVPCAFLPLQPEQFVSITLDPGAMEIIGLPVRAVTGAAPQPARTRAAGPSTSIAPRSSVPRKPRPGSFAPLSASRDEVCEWKVNGVDRLRIRPKPRSAALRLAHLIPHRSRTLSLPWSKSTRRRRLAGPRFLDEIPSDPDPASIQKPEIPATNAVRATQSSTALLHLR